MIYTTTVSHLKETPAKILEVTAINMPFCNSRHIEAKLLLTSGDIVSINWGNTPSIILSTNSYFSPAKDSFDSVWDHFDKKENGEVSAINTIGDIVILVHGSDDNLNFYRYPDQPLTGISFPDIVSA